MAKAPKDRVTAGDVQDLAVAIEQLAEEARLLRISLDVLRDDVVWAARQVLATGYQVSGTPPLPPRDSLTADHARSASREQPVSIDQATDNESSAESPYCCDRPTLRWNGDPDAPGIACENCGYVVAEQGNVVI